MPWGLVQAPFLRLFRTQLREVFIDRVYAFDCDSERPVIIDCGANIGMASLWFFHRFPNATVIAYEPDERLCAMARANLATAGHAEADVICAAVWDRNASLAFDAIGDDSGAVSTKGTSTVRGVDLAEHLPERVDLLKMDIEGGEFVVVPHLCRTGAIARVRRFTIEFHVSQARVDDFLSIATQLRESGFVLRFRSVVETWLGREATDAPFPTLGGGKMFVQVYGWREG